MKRQEARNKLIDEFTAALLRISMKIRPITTGPRLSFPNRKFFSGSKTPNHCTPSSTFSVRKKNGAQRARPQNYLIIRQTEPKVDKTKFKHSPLYHTHTHTRYNYFDIQGLECLAPLPLSRHLSAKLNLAESPGGGMRTPIHSGGEVVGSACDNLVSSA